MLKKNKKYSRLQTWEVISGHQANSRKHRLSTFRATRDAEDGASYLGQMGI